MTYYLDKLFSSATTAEMAMNYGQEHGYGVYFALVDGSYIAVLSNTEIKTDDILTIRKERKSSGFTFRYGYQQQKVAITTKGYRATVVPITEVRGAIEIYLCL